MQERSELSAGMVLVTTESFPLGLMNTCVSWEKPWGESYPYFITCNNYFYIPFTAGEGELAADCCYFIKSATAAGSNSAART